MTFKKLLYLGGFLILGLFIFNSKALAVGCDEVNGFAGELDSCNWNLTGNTLSVTLALNSTGVADSNASGGNFFFSLQTDAGETIPPDRFTVLANTDPQTFNIDLTPYPGDWRFFAFTSAAAPWSAQSIDGGIGTVLFTITAGQVLGVSFIPLASVGQVLASTTPIATGTFPAFAIIIFTVLGVIFSVLVIEFIISVFGRGSKSVLRHK